MERRLAAILAANIVGHSRLMEADEEGTIKRQKAYRSELIDPEIAGYGGRAEEALGHIETAMRLNPNFPFWYYYALGASQFMLTRYDAAAGNLEKTIERNPNWLSSHRMLVAAYGHLNRLDDAEWEMEELRALGFEPTMEHRKARIQYKDPAYLERYLEGLRKAGVPER